MAVVALVNQVVERCRFEGGHTKTACAQGPEVRAMTIGTSRKHLEKQGPSQYSTSMYAFLNINIHLL